MKKPRFIIATLVLVFSLVLVGSVLAAASRDSAGAIAAPLLQEAGELPTGEGPWVVRAYYTDQQMINEVAAILEPWEVNREAGYIVVEVNREQYQWMQWLGFRLEVDEKLTALYTQPAEPLPGQITAIPGYPCYRTVEETLLTGSQIATDYPELAEWVDIGDSWEKATPGDLPGWDLKVLVLTNESIPGPKPKLFAMGSIHAREYTTAELVTRFAEHLVESYNTDPDITWLLDHHEVHLLLQTNPDGRKKAETGLSWRKNTNNNYCTDTNNRGADLNRNFDFQWGCCGGSSPSPCDLTYRGPSAASEPETDAVQDYILAQFPDQREPDLSAPAPITATGVFLDIHSYSQLVLWPWGFTSTPAGNSTQLQTLGRKFAYFNNYSPDPSITLYPTDGTTVDYAYGQVGVAAYTFELGTAFFQDCATFESTILPDNMEALLYAAKAARFPYMTPGGPDTLNVAATPAAAAPGDPVALTAIANDTRFFDDNGTEPTQNIAAAEYYIDVPPWSTDPAPVAYPMTAADGAFNEKIEDVQATIDTSGLSTGRHMLFVRGQDVNGNWGQVSAAFLYIVNPLTAPKLEGYVRDYSTNAPLLATVTAGSFTTDTLPASGFYHMAVVSGTYDISAQADGYGGETVAGIYAPENSRIQQNFNLLPTCTIFSDDVESGNLGWTVQAPWAITTESSHSPTHSWTESPGTQYSNYRNISITSPVFDLTGVSGVSLSFWQTIQTEDCCDFGYVEYSTNGGSTWSTAVSYSGDHPDWAEETVPLPLLDNQASARIRFRFYSDPSITDQGWHIDDILLTGGSPDCFTPLAPTADFTSNSPALLGEAVRFTNLVQGSHRLEFAWDFGDAGGTSTLSDPEYTYAASGTYMVTMTVTNSLGSDSASHPVVIGACTPIEAVTLTLQTPGLILLGEPVSLLADIGPQDANKPYEYAVDYGDGSLVTGVTSDDPLSLTYTYTQAGEFPILFSAQNCGITPITDSLTVDIYGEAGTTISPTVDAALALPGETVTYTLRVTNTGSGSNTYDLELGEHLWETELVTTTLGPLPPDEGQDFTVRVRVPQDAAAGASDAVTVTVHSGTPGILPVYASLTTTAGSVYGVGLAPALSEGQSMPGGVVTHTLVLTNTGNTTDTFTIETSSDWPVTVSVPPGISYLAGAVTLAGGQSTALFAQVAIPASPGSDESTASLVATSSSDPLVSEQASLKTRVVLFQVHLPLVPAQE